MTVEDCIQKITRYKKGFQFMLPYNQMDERTRIAAYKVTRIAEERGLIKSVFIGAGWNEDGSFNGFQNETFVRI